MMKVYKKPRNGILEKYRFTSIVLILFMGVASVDLSAQCIRTASWGTLTVSDQTTTATNISSCIYTSEYSVITVNDPGQYEFTINVSGGYLTLTDGSNTVIDHGTTPLTVSIPATGTYRIHYADDAACNSTSTCFVSTAQYVGPLGGGSISVQIGFGTTVANNSLYFPVYRFNATSGNNSNRSFGIFEEAELIAAGITPGSTIESIGFEKDDGGTLPGKDLEMKIYMRAGTTTPPLASTSWVNSSAGAALVYDDDIAFAATDDWVDFTFSTPFVYTGGTLEIATENFMAAPSPYSTDAFKWKYDNTFGTNHVIGRIGFGSFSTLDLISSAAYSHRPNTRFDVVAPTGTDLAMQGFVAPLAACPGSTDLIVSILNAGSEDVDTATIGWSLNGVAQTSVTWTGNIGTGDTAHVNLGSFTTAASTLYNIDAYIQNVGPGLDTNTTNDSIATAYQAALDGAFTINAGAPASGTNYQSFTDAIGALNTFGICGPVTFTAAADTFNEQIILEDVSGASATNTITFIGAGAGNTVLSFEQNTSDDRYTWRFDGASYVTVDSMSIVADDAGTYGWAVHMTNGANNITVQNCDIATSQTSASSFFNGVVISGSNVSYFTGVSDAHDITFHNNHFFGGYNTIVARGASATDRVENLVITNNVMDNAGQFYGLYMYSCSGVTIDNNIINGKINGSASSYGLFFFGVNDFTITNNKIVDFGQYGIYMSSSAFAGNTGGDATNRSLIANNSIGGGYRSTSTFASAYRVLNGTYIDFVFNSINFDNGNGRALSITGTNTTMTSNHRILNNSIVYAGGGTGYALYIGSANVIEEINNNAYYSDGSNYVFYGSALANLAALQAVNNPLGNDANSITANPLYTSDYLLVPFNGLLSGAAAAFAGVTTDITGATRATPPDIGAYEFVPVNADVALIAGELVNGECLSTNDSVELYIVNTLGSTINFSSDSIVAHFDVTGPANSNGTVVFNSGNLAEGDTAMAFATGVDLSIPGIYTLNAYIDTNAVNESSANDTLSAVSHEVRPVFSVTPTSVTVTNDQDSVEVTARSPFMPGGDFFITEICHFRGSANGAPSTGWPSYLIADDYIEITGVPSSDLGGITLEVWTTTAQNTDYTFPPGTMMSPNGTAIIATAQLGASQPSPSDFYYHGNGAFTASYGSATAIGYILKDAGGNIIDACAYSGFSPYVFPAAANVSTADWSGSVASGSGTAGIRLEGAYTKNATNWLVSSATNRQDPNAVNPSVVAPVPGNVTGLEWSFGGSVIDTTPSVFVGPFATPGTYYAVATFQTPCGLETDSVEIMVDFPFCFEPDSVEVNAVCEDAELSWITGQYATHNTSVEFGPAGFTQGSGSFLMGVTSPVTMDSLLPGTDYDYYIYDSCTSTDLEWTSDNTLGTVITSEYDLSPTTSTLSSCNGTLEVIIPSGATINSIDVEYDIAAGSGAWMSEQRSYVRCVSPGGVAEASIASGTGTGGTFSYNRTGLTIANAVTGADTLVFELHNFRTWGGSACAPVYNDVVPNSFKITVHHDTIVTTFGIGESVTSGTFRTLDFPDAGSINYTHDGTGGYTFDAGVNAVGSLSWDFGDGNGATGDTVFNQYSTEGSYTVTVVATNACGSDTATRTLAYISVDNFRLNNVSIYPNPSRGDIVIDQLPVDGGEITMMIYDMAGKSVYTKLCELGIQRMDLGLGHLNAGTYFISLSNDYGRITKPVVIVK